MVLGSPESRSQRQKDLSAISSERWERTPLCLGCTGCLCGAQPGGCAVSLSPVAARKEDHHKRLRSEASLVSISNASCLL